MSENKALLISFSGGRTSAFMARLLFELPQYKNYKKLVVFANTGKEREETLAFVDKCDKEFNLNVVYVEAVVNNEKGKGTDYKIVDYKTASRNGEPFEAVIEKYGLPSKLWRHCTREMKEQPIKKIAENMLGDGYLTALGIRADEKHRIGKKKNYIYPLAEINVDEKFIRNWWSRQSFDLDLKDYEGNCDLCFLKSERKKLTLLLENPKLAEWWNAMELKHGTDRQMIFDEYRELSIVNLIEKSKLPFRKVVDKNELRKMQGNFFDEMDVEFDCFCKSV